MKKKLLLYIFLFATLTSYAQSDTITLAPNYKEGWANLDDLSTGPGDVKAQSLLTNNSAVTKTFVWERIVNELPAGTLWKSAICIGINCFIPSVNTGEFDLMPNEVDSIDIHMYPGGSPGALSGALPGEGEVQLRIWEKDNEGNAEVGVYPFTIVTDATSTENLANKQLRLFPNPVIDFVQIQENTIVEEVEIFNLIGERVKYFPTNNGLQYNVSDLRKGMYLFRMLDKDKGVLKTIKMIKA